MTGRDVEQHIEAVWTQRLNAVKYTVLIEKASSNYAAYLPDLTGYSARIAGRVRQCWVWFS